MKDKLRRMKADPEDKLVEQNCSTCEFSLGDVCGHVSEVIIVRIHMGCQ